MGGHVYSRTETVQQIVADKGERPFAQRRQRFGGNHAAMAKKEAEQRSVQAEDGARCARTYTRRVPSEARCRTSQPAHQIENDKRNPACQAFQEQTNVEQDEHIKKQMNKAEMQKGGDQHTPPLPV